MFFFFFMMLTPTSTHRWVGERLDRRPANTWFPLHHCSSGHLCTRLWTQADQVFTFKSGDFNSNSKCKKEVPLISLDIFFSAAFSVHWISVPRPTISQGLAEKSAFCHHVKAYQFFFFNQCLFILSGLNLIQKNTDSSLKVALFALQWLYYMMIYIGLLYYMKWPGVVGIRGWCFTGKEFSWQFRLLFMSEHPSGTWGCWFGAFLLDLFYHICLILCPLRRVTR